MTDSKKPSEIAEEIAKTFLNDKEEIVVDKDLLMTIIIVALGMFIKNNELLPKK